MCTSTHFIKSIHLKVHLTAFDANPSVEVRGSFLDLSKAFNKVWHEGLLYKLKHMKIGEKYFGLID